jgi:hypothetical protein
MFKDDVAGQPLTDEQEEEEAKDDNLSNSTQKRFTLRKSLAKMKQIADEGNDDAGNNPLLKEKQNIIQATQEDKDDYKDFINQIKAVATGKLKPKDLEKAVDTEDVDIDNLISKGTFTKKQLKKKMDRKMKQIEETNRKIKAIRDGKRMPRRKKHSHPRLKQDEVDNVQLAKDDASRELTELAQGSG